MLFPTKPHQPQVCFTDVRAHGDRVEMMALAAQDTTVQSFRYRQVVIFR